MKGLDDDDDVHVRKGDGRTNIQKFKVLIHIQLDGGINLIFCGNHGELES
jgi:hypothetical protein